MHCIYYSLSQKSLGILFTRSSLHQFLYNSIRFHLIWDFHACIPRQVGRSCVFEGFYVVLTPLHYGPGIQLSFVISKIQPIPLGHFKPCFLSGPFPECIFSFSGVLLHILSPAFILVLIDFASILQLLLCIAC